MAEGKLVVVAGNSNVEVTCPVAFPMDYQPTRFATGELEVRASGAAYNVAVALVHLGTRVKLATFVGQDLLAEVIRRELEANIGLVHLSPCTDSPRSIVLYSEDGRRYVITDLREIASPALEHVNPETLLDGADLLVAGNINANRRLVHIAHDRGVPVATDVGPVSSPVDEHNAEFLRAASILFASNMNLVGREADLVRGCGAQNVRATMVIGLGERGALLIEPDSGGPVHLPAHTVGQVVNTGGAGDALFAAFLDRFVRGMPAIRALERAVVFAGAKVTARSASEGHLQPDALAEQTDSYRQRLKFQAAEPRAAEVEDQ